MSQGYSFESFAGRIKVNRDSLYEWAKRHEAFSDAMRIGKDSSLYFWERQGIDGLFSETIREKGPDGTSTSHTKTLNAPVWILSMKNRHGWREKQEIETTDPQTEALREEVKALVAELDRLEGLKK